MKTTTAQRPCRGCGTPIERPIANQQYCSQECKPKPKAATRACATCETEFRPYGGQRYCQASCNPANAPSTYVQPAPKNPPRECVRCGQKWKPKNPAATYTTCWRCRQVFGPDHEYGTIKGWKDAVRKRVGSNCQKCGSPDDLHVHHLIPRSRGGKNTLRNAQVLCATCHQETHARRDLPPEGFYAPGSKTSAGVAALIPHF